MMRVIDENGRDVERPDLSKGYLIRTIAAKADAAPIDDVEKFAWDDDDYEEVDMYVALTDERRAEMERREAEAAEAAARAEALAGVPPRMEAVEAAQADTDDALCAVFEESIALKATVEDQDAAICALYELGIGGAV